jgi:hypothetical protein
MQQSSIFHRIFLRRALRAIGGLVLVAFLVVAVTSNFFGSIEKTGAVEINSPNKYLLDGWEMSNSNALGRMAPTVNRNGADLIISGGREQRLDNSGTGFANSPLFASVNASNPSAITPQVSNGRTSLASLTLNGGSAITTTPLDFISNSPSWDSWRDSFGIKMTGFFYDSSYTGNLKFTAAADNGFSIEVYSGGGWSEVSDGNYGGFSMPTNLGDIDDVSYNAGDYLPVRITYYDGGSYGGFIPFVNEGADWYVPKKGGSNFSGKFFTMADNASPEGFVTDYFTDNNDQSTTYNPNDARNQYAQIWGGHFNISDSSSFSIDRYRFSFIDTKYMKNFDDGDCSTVEDSAYTWPLWPNAVANCGGGEGGVFTRSNATLVNQSPLADELYSFQSSSSSTVHDWKGGRSKLLLDVSGVIDMNDGAIDVSGCGWPAGSNPVGGNPGAIDFDLDLRMQGRGPGGGWSIYNSFNNGRGGGGAFGGQGDSTEYYYGIHRGASRTYGTAYSVSYLGSGGGTSKAVDVIGGSGGGMIDLNVGNINFCSTANCKIIAKGDMGETIHSREGGAGSGGSIHIRSSQTLSLSSSPVINANGGTAAADRDDWKGKTFSGYGGGGRVLIEGPNSGGGFANITARAGCADYPASNCTTRIDFIPSVESIADHPEWWAREGTVIISSNEAMTVKKKLEAIDRSGYGINFNPYALQVGDKIQVRLTVSNFQAGLGFVLSDEFLKNVSGSVNKCEFISGSAGTSGTASPYASPDPPPTDSEIVWPAYNATSTDVSAGTIDFWYQCQVK